MSVIFDGCRHSHFQDLVSWAKANGSSCDGLQIANFGKEGYGLQATRDIKVRITVVSIVLYCRYEPPQKVDIGIKVILTSVVKIDLKTFFFFKFVIVQVVCFSSKSIETYVLMT